MIRAVLDTNVLISSVIGRGSPYEVVVASRQEAFLPVCSPYIIEEFRLIMTSKLHFASQDVDDIALKIAKSCDLVPVFEASQRWCTDAADDAIVETALRGMATHVVTGDARLCSTQVDLIEFVDPTSFLRLIGR